MKGKYYSLNFPLRDGISDENYKSVFEPVDIPVREIGQEFDYFIAGNTTSNGNLRSIGDCAAVWHGFIVRGQAWLSEFIDAR